VSEHDIGDLSDLAEVYKALGNEKRLAVLLQLERGESVSPLTDELGITRSGLQKNIERLIDARLVYRPVDSDQTYKLTALGEYFINEIYREQTQVEEVLSKFNTRLEDLQEEEQETLDRMKEAGVDTKELEQKLEAEAWQNLD